MVSRSPGLRRPRLSAAQAERIPPGQYLTGRWPVRHDGSIPSFDPTTWEFRVFGLVDHPLRFSWEEFRALPRVTVAADLHCVTRWSTLANIWEGVALRHIMELAGPKPEATFVLFQCEGDYATNLPLAAASDDVLFALKHDGAELTPAHGYPLRAVVPKRYAWKSAKWIRGVEFMAQDRRGFWERYGYHDNADVWNEERFAE